jgi:hypothetical protein
MLFAIGVLFFANNKLIEGYISAGGGDIIIAIAGLGTVLTAALQYIKSFRGASGATQACGK